MTSAQLKLHARWRYPHIDKVLRSTAALVGTFDTPRACRILNRGHRLDVFLGECFFGTRRVWFTESSPGEVLGYVLATQ